MTALPLYSLTPIAVSVARYLRTVFIVPEDTRSPYTAFIHVYRMIDSDIRIEARDRCVEVVQIVILKHDMHYADESFTTTNGEQPYFGRHLDTNEKWLFSPDTILEIQNVIGDLQSVMVHFVE